MSLPDDTKPSAEAREAGKKLIGALVITHGMGIHADRLREAENEAALALDRFRAAGVREVIDAARKCARFKCRMTDDILRCPDCGATVEGNDAVNGVCQADAIRDIRANVIEQYLRGASS